VLKVYANNVGPATVACRIRFHIKGGNATAEFYKHNKTKHNCTPRFGLQTSHIKGKHSWLLLQANSECQYL
jgi:hypothetical protein